MTPTTATPRPDVRLYLSESKRDTFGEYFTVRLSIVYVNDEGKIRNPSRSDVWSANPTEVAVAGYENLDVSAQASRGETRLYGYDRLRYRDVFGADERDLVLMLKTLKRINRHLERLAIRFGHPEDFAAFAARVADALGVSTDRPFGVIAEPARDYDGTGFRWMGVEGLRMHLNELLRAWAPETASA